MTETTHVGPLASFRSTARENWDRIFCRPHPGLARVGKESGWWIRRDLLPVNSFVISGGAGNDISFELALARDFGCQVWLFDPTPTATACIQKVIAMPKALSFFSFALSVADGNLALDPPEDEGEGSWKTRPARSRSASRQANIFPARSIGSLTREASKTPVLVKLDVEGSEYGILREMMRSGIRPRMIAVEFHHFLPGFSRIHTLASVARLHLAGYRIQHKSMTDYLFVRKSCPAGPAAEP